MSALAVIFGPLAFLALLILTAWYLIRSADMSTKKAMDAIMKDLLEHGYSAEASIRRRTRMGLVTFRSAIQTLHFNGYVKSTEERFGLQNPDLHTFWDLTHEGLVEARRQMREAAPAAHS